ncbi:alpha/beta hydrolase [Parasediminibacterium sp. JCM 36343]|uniref:alpha/beta hydrolase n=1 Tax=Parasediminibacterium sp. JCM 36343 TaxID=3374279 RepID=UPI00397B21BD
MKKIALLVGLFIAIALHLQAQFSIRLVVTDVATKKQDDIYVSGTFNNWNPKDEKYKLKPFAGGRKSIVIKDVAPGNYAFKFTRGNFDKVECMADGRDISDRVADVAADVSLECNVAGWKDDYPERPKRYTASPQVKIIDTAFVMPQLGRTRRIWLYLPKSYSTSTKTYPVLYMQDGQNLFNEQTAAYGEWGIDECLDTLAKQMGRECIVVGIDHGGEKRLNEYSPYDFSTKGALATQDTKGEGAAYTEFLVKTLKPFIDGKYRTKKGREYTYIAGSSMGALVSEYAILKYPEVFGAAGMFSPAFWIAPNLYTEVENAPAPPLPILPRFYFYAGGKESSTMVSDVDRMYNLISKKDQQHEIERKINPLGEHKEKYWQQAFPAFYIWLMKKVD